MTERLHSLALEGHILQELEGFVLLVGRLRFAALGLLALLAALLVASGDAGWRLAALAAAGALVALQIRTERSDGPLDTARLVVRVATVFVVHTAIIAVTGGVLSPLLPLYVPVAVVLAVAVGRGAWLGLVVGALNAVVALMLAGRLTGLARLEVPELLRAAPLAPDDPLLLTLRALGVALILTGGSLIGLTLRAHLERAALAVMAARGETLATLQTQHHALGELSSTLAHELKNPLAAIQGLSGLVDRKLAPGSREAEQMGVLVGEVRRLGSILDEFLNLSRPLEDLATAEVDPATVLAQIAQLYEGAALAAGVSIDVRATATPALRCDPRKVRQVLVNLMENALHAARAAGGRRVVLGSGPAGPDRVAFTVRDDGAGLPPGGALRLFESGVTTRPDGSGLGLTVARAIAAQHGGDIELTDAPGGGAVATLTLPLAPEATT